MDDGATLDDAHLLGLPDLFLQHHHVPLLGVDGVLTLLRARAIHRYVCTVLALYIYIIIRIYTIFTRINAAYNDIHIIVLEVPYKLYA